MSRWEQWLRHADLVGCGQGVPAGVSVGNGLGRSEDGDACHLDEVTLFKVAKQGMAEAVRVFGVPCQVSFRVGAHHTSSKLLVRRSRLPAVLCA